MLYLRLKIHFSISPCWTFTLHILLTFSFNINDNMILLGISIVTNTLIHTNKVSRQ